MMQRKWVLALAAMGVAMAVIFPLELLWVGQQTPLEALVSALLSGVLSMAGVLSYKPRDPGAAASEYPMPLVVRIMLVGLLAVLLAALLFYEAYNDGLAHGAVWVVTILLAVLGGLIARKCDLK